MDKDDNIEERIKDINDEVLSWGLTREQSVIIAGLLQTLHNVHKSFNCEVVNNRYVCPVCITKNFVEKSLNSNEVIGFLQEIESQSPGEQAFFDTTKELFLMFYICNMLSTTKFDYVVKHINDFIKLTMGEKTYQKHPI
jgi:hypothetical protein